MAARKKKATRKKAARKKAARKKTGRKKAARKKKARARKSTSLLGDRLPKSLKAFAKELRKDLNSIERQIESAGKDGRKRLSRVLRDVSHQLGALEARGEKEWRSMSKSVEREVEKALKSARKATRGSGKKK